MNVNISLKDKKTFVRSSLMRYFFIFLTLCAISGCTNQKTFPKQVFFYNETTGTSSLDPAFAKNQSIMWPVHQLYNTLVEIDSSLNIVHSLARSREISDNRLVYIFLLRDGILFHDNYVFPGGKGRILTAKDVVFSFQRIMDKTTASIGAWIFNNRIVSLSGFKSLDDSTFQLQLLRPFHPILGNLSMQYCSIVPFEVVQKYGKNFRSHSC